MKLTNEKLSSDYMKHLQEQQRHTVAAKQAELKHLNKEFEKQEQKIRKSGQQQLQHERLAIKKELQQVKEQHIKDVAQLKKQHDLENFQMLTMHKGILQQSKQRNEDLHQQLKDNYITQLEQIEELNRDVNDKTKESIIKIKQDAEDQIDKKSFETKLLVNEHENRLQQKLSQEEEQFNTMIERQRKQFSSKMHTSKIEQASQLAETQRKNKILLENAKQTGDHQLKYQRNFYHQKLLQEKESFQKTLKQQIAMHKKILSRIKHKFETSIEKLKETTAKVADSKISKSSDPFYRLTTLQPQLIEGPKDVTIKLPLPEHERENFHFSIEDKEINLNLTRRYADKYIANDGSINNSKRSEVITKKITLPYHLNKKSVTQNFQNNILTIHINKDA